MADRQPVVRFATAADTAEVLRLATLMYESMGIDASGTEWRQASFECLAERLGHDAAVFVVDDPSQPGRLVATGAGTIARRLPSPPNPGTRIGYVQWVSTEPEWRRRGFARQIMLSLLDWFRDNDVPVVELHATPPGEPLYQELGFQKGRTPGLRLRLEPAPEGTLPKA